ncbi:MAG TPA: DNA topoisomerase VI subunit B [Candidatus Binatia bacterium]|nr:DNA topoisomerase VI subunit B [Candidatus Binatia bacterium]
MAKPMPKSNTDTAEAQPRQPKTVTAVEMGARQREISVSEFFTKNRHLLGFDNPRKALLTCVKEAVDNALDACEEADILPEVIVKLEVVANGGPAPAPSQANRFRVTVIDYGPGIVRQQIPRIFAKLLYGSKFHRLRMSRGQQGIGISAAGMYAQLTTGKPVQIISRTGARTAAHYFEVQIDTKKNEPRILEKKEIEWENHRGTQVTLEIEGRYQKGRASVDEYLEQTAIANPHVKLVYHTPEGEIKEYPRTIDELPPQPREIKPHPYGIEFGILLKMLHDTRSQTLAGFLSGDFSRVSSNVAHDICKTAKLSANARPRNIHGAAAETLYKAIQSTKIMAPPSNCISPIGEKAILHGLYKQIKGDFYTAVTRPPAVYRGNPFIIEAGLAFGKGPDQSNGKAEHPAQPLAEGEHHEDDDELASVIRYANRVPLLYQQSACSTFKAVLDTSWRNYGVPQSRGALPAGPMVIFVHMASVWVPFTSESKEAIADYDEIRKEIKLALQECGRRLGVFLRRRERAKSEFRRRNIFDLYIEEVVEACNRLKGGKLPKEKLKEQLQKIAMKRTGGEKTDEILGYDGGGPEGLPHSIIVTPEGTEGEAPVIEGRDEVPPQQEELIEEEPAETPHVVSAKSKKRARDQVAKASKSEHGKSDSSTQMSLGFEAEEGKRNPKAGRKHGAKKAKK